MRLLLDRKPTAEQVGFVCALFIVAWSPFTGGPRLFSVVLACLGAWWMLRARGLTHMPVPARRLGLIFLLLWVPVLLSLPQSFDKRGTLLIGLLLPIYYLAGVGLLHVLRVSERRAALALGISVVLVLWAGDGLLQYITGQDLLAIPLSADGRVVGFFESNLRLGVFLAVLLPLLMRQAHVYPYWTIVPAVALCAAVIVLSGARSSWLMLTLAIILSLSMLPKRMRLLLALLACVAVAFVASSGLVQEKWQQTTVRQWTFSAMDETLSRRLTIWETALAMAKDKPWTGVGAGNGAFSAAYDHYAIRADDPFRRGQSYPGGVYHAHQLYIAAWAETGVIGFAALISIWYLLLRWRLRATLALRMETRPYAFALFIAAFPINSQPVLYTNWWFPILLLLTCTLLAAYSDEDSDTHDAGPA